MDLLAYNKCVINYLVSSFSFQWHVMQAMDRKINGVGEIGMQRESEREREGEEKKASTEEESETSSSICCVVIIARETHKTRMKHTFCNVGNFVCFITFSLVRNVCEHHSFVLLTHNSLVFFSLIVVDSSRSSMLMNT